MKRSNSSAILEQPWAHSLQPPVKSYPYPPPSTHPHSPHHTSKQHSVLQSSHRLKEFYQTFGNSQLQSFTHQDSKKQSDRKRLQHRPETSKGPRSFNPWNRPLGCHLSHSQSQHFKQRSVMEAGEQPNPSAQDIDIIVTRSTGIQNRKSKIYRSKFDTDLDDQFLELFAS